MYWHKDRHIDRWDRLDGPEINFHIYDQIIFTVVPRPINGERQSFFSKLCWEYWVSTYKIIKLNPYLIPYAKINSK